MAGFYAALGPGPGRNRSRALRRAALQLIRDARFRHPYYWAGFVVLGHD
jgi:CHAT domain-containing protein